jgi:hypothetical protein
MTKKNEESRGVIPATPLRGEARGIQIRSETNVGSTLTFDSLEKIMGKLRLG